MAESSNEAEVNVVPTSFAPRLPVALPRFFGTKSKSAGVPVLERSNSMVISDDFQQDRQRFLVTVFVGTVACLSVVMALTAMYLESSFAAFAAFVFPLFVAPYTIHQRRQINKLPELMDEIKKCQSQVSRLAAENISLHTSMNSLRAQIKELADVDDQLAAAARANNEDVSTLRMLIYTNGSLQRQMKQYLHAQDLQHLLTTLLACDADKNFVISDSELDQLILRLESLGSRVPKEVLKEALENATMKPQSTSNLYRTLLNLDLSRGCGDISSAGYDESGDCYVEFPDFEEQKTAT